MKYAAFAAALVIVAGVVFLAVRRRTEPVSLVASNEQQERINAVQSDRANDSAPEAKTNDAASASSPSLTTTDQATKRPETPVPGAATAASPLAAMKDMPRRADEAEKKAEVNPDQPAIARTQPSYAPAPPGETTSATRAGAETGGVAYAGSVRPEASAKVATTDRFERDAVKEARVETTRSSNLPSLVTRKADDDKLKGPSRNMDNVSTNNQNANQVKDAPKTMNEGRATEESPQTRSAGGRKFHRQGNAWVDQKFKSSMPVKNISRGSEEFSALDAGLRSIAQQLSGEIIVVWKGKAYLIR